MIGLVGATGQIGGRVAALLAGRDDVSALARSSEAEARLSALGVPAVRGDLADPASLPGALAGVRRLLVVTPYTPSQAHDELALIAAAREAGVERVVKLSVIEVGSADDGAITRSHREIEEGLAASGLEHTVVRSDYFASNLLEQVDLIRGGVLAYPYADAPIAPVSPDDVAEVLAAALTAGEPLPAVIEVTGSQAVTPRTLADRIRELSGRPLEFLEADPADWRGGLVAFGLEPWFADALLEVLAGYAARQGDPVREGVAAVLGRPAQGIDEYLRAELVPALASR